MTNTVAIQHANTLMQAKHAEYSTPQPDGFIAYCIFGDWFKDNTTVDYEAIKILKHRYQHMYSIAKVLAVVRPSN